MADEPPTKALTLKQRRVARVLASDKADTKLEAAKLARVGRVTLWRAEQNENVQREIARLQGSWRDKAREIAKVSGDGVLEDVRRPDTDPLTRIAAWKTAHQVIQMGTEGEETGPTAADHERFKARQRRNLERAYVVGWLALAQLLEIPRAKALELLGNSQGETPPPNNEPIAT